MNGYSYCSGFLICIFMTVTGTVQSQEFRSFNPVLTPKIAPEDSKPVEAIRPVDRAKAEAATEEVLKSWNKGNALQNYLSDNFYEKDRLGDAMMDKVPRDASLRLISVQGVQTLEQFQKSSSETGKKEIISTVSVTARTQIEFNDPSKGFRRLDGTNEYLLRITEEFNQ